MVEVVRDKQEAAAAAAAAAAHGGLALPCPALNE